MEWLGRLNTVKLAAIPCVIGWALIASADNFIQLLIGRILTGYFHNLQYTWNNISHGFCYVIYVTLFFNEIRFFSVLDQQWVRAQQLYTLPKLHDLICEVHWFLQHQRWLRSVRTRIFYKFWKLNLYIFDWELYFLS